MSEYQLALLCFAVWKDRMHAVGTRTATKAMRKAMKKLVSLGLCVQTMDWFQGKKIPFWEPSHKGKDLVSNLPDCGIGPLRRAGWMK